MSRYPQYLVWVVLVMSIVLLGGCASNPAGYQRRGTSLSEDVRSTLGTIRVESAAVATQAEFAKPLTPGQAAAKGAFESSMDLLGGASGSGSMGAMVAVAIIPFAAGIGAATSVSKGTPEEEIQAMESALLRAFSQMDCQRTVREQVVQYGRRNTRHPMVTGSSQGGQPAAADSVMQLNVLGAGLAGDTDKGAQLTMFLRVNVRLSSARNGKLLYDQTFVQTGGLHTFNQWAANDGRLFRNQLQGVGKAVAQAIIEEVFLSYRP